MISVCFATKNVVIERGHGLPLVFRDPLELLYF